MADNNKQLLVVLDKYKDRADELVVSTATAKNRKAVESNSADTMDMKTFISRSFPSKMFVNIFDGDSEEWLWKTNPKVSHIHARCVELWGPKPVESEEEPAEAEESEVESEEEPAEAEESEDLFAAARQAAANRKSSTTSKPSTKKANSSKPSKKATELEEDLDEEEEINDAEPVKKSGGLIWVLAIIALAIMSISIYLTLKPGREMETLGLTSQYVEATNHLNREIEPAWWRWESWDRSVAAEATMAWGPYFRALYVDGNGGNPTSNSIQLYAVYLTIETLVSQGIEPGEALRVIREEGSETIVTALKSGNISPKDTSFVREYLMK